MWIHVALESCCTRVETMWLGQGCSRAWSDHGAVFFKTFCTHVSSCENVTDHSHGSRVPPSCVSRAPPLPGELALFTASHLHVTRRRERLLPHRAFPVLKFATKKFKIFFFHQPEFYAPLLVQKNLDIASFRGTNCRQFLGARGTVSRAGLDKQADGSAAPSPCNYSPIYIPRSAELGLPAAFPFLPHLAPGRAPHTGSRQISRHMRALPVSPFKVAQD